MATVFTMQSGFMQTFMEILNLFYKIMTEIHSSRFFLFSLENLMFDIAKKYVNCFISPIY